MVNKAILYGNKVLPQVKSLRVHAFRAIDNPILCQEYAQGHVDLLKQYGVTSITSNNRVWERHKNTFIIVVRDEADGKMVGGIRIQKFDEDFQLPVQTAIGIEAPNIHTLIRHDAERGGGTGEMCGLWNSKSVAQMKVSWMLTRASVAICSQIGVNSLWGICANYTLPMFEDVGYRIIEEIGDQGAFSYPTPEYVSHPVRMSTIELGAAGKQAQKEILGYRARPIQARRLEGEWFRLKLNFNLLLSTT